MLRNSGGSRSQDRDADPGGAPGGAPLDIDIYERGIKKAIPRKNDLFYIERERGSWGGDVFMSRIPTAEQNGKPFDYLSELLRHAPQVRENAEAWTP